MNLLYVKRYETSNNTIHSHITFQRGNNYAYFAGIERKNYEIPEGNYKAQITHSPHFNANLYLIDVADRQGIRIHHGNTYKDVTGCLIIGQFRRANSILHSKNSVNLLHTLSKGEKLYIHISNEKSNRKNLRKSIGKVLRNLVKWIRKNASN